MKTFNLIAIAAAMLVSTTAGAFADPTNSIGGVDALNALRSATYATVLTVNPTEAGFLMNDTDSAALQHRVAANTAIANTLAAQGYAPSDVVGIDGNGNGNSVTLYVL